MPLSQKKARSANINQAVLKRSSDLLKNLPGKSQQMYNLREAVELLQTPILTALEKGYSYEEIASFLAKEKIEISPSSLRFYLTALRRQQTSEPIPKTKTTRREHHKQSSELRLTSLKSPRNQTSKAGSVVSFLLED